MVDVGLTLSWPIWLTKFPVWIFTYTLNLVNVGTNFLF